MLKLFCLKLGAYSFAQFLYHNSSLKNLRLAPLLQVKVFVFNSAGSGFCCNSATDAFCNNYAGDSDSCSYAGFMFVVFSAAVMLVDLSVAIM